jgi:hypothetical protein
MPEETLSLLWDEVRDSAVSLESSWVRLLRPKQRRLTGSEHDRTVIARIREFRAAFPNPNLPPMPRLFSQARSGKILAQAERSWAFLVLQSLGKIDGETGLLLDTQSLLFFANLHYLLPNLKEQKYTSEHDCLVNAMYMHLFAWAHLPSHLYYLGGQLMDYLGKRKARDRMLLESLRLTSPEDHAYLTTVQDYWSNLIEERRYTEGNAFLSALKNQGLPSQRGEIDRMLQYTEECLHDKTQARAGIASS